MNRVCKRVLSVALALVLVLALMPATAQKAEAADGDVTSQGVVLFEEDFDHASLAELKAAHNYWADGNETPTIEEIDGDKCLVYTNATTNSIMQFTFSDLDIPGSNDGPTGTRPIVSILAEITYKTEGSGKMFATIGNFKYPNTTAGTLDLIPRGNMGYPSEATVPFTPNDGTSGTKNDVCFIKDSSEMVTDSIGRYTGYQVQPINYFTLQIGSRGAGTDGVNKVIISHVKISLILSDRGNPITIGHNMVPYLASGNGYFKLASDATSENGSLVAQDLVLGTNAVLDLNGYTLTIPSGKKLVVGSNARIVDTSTGKTGKIVADEGSVTILNQDHPGFPIYTGDGYIFTEPKLEMDKQVRFADVSGLGFTLHFRPGFGTEVRENYLSKIDTGVQMTATLSWVDSSDGTGSTDLVCDDMFKQMYLTQTSRGELRLTGAENYKSITLTITLTSCEMSKSFVVNFKNDYVHLVYQGSTFINGGVGHNFTTAVGDEGIWVLDCNLAYYGENPNNFSFRRYANSKWLTLFGSQYGGSGTVLYNGMNLSATPTHVHMEVDLATGAYVLSLNGVPVARADAHEELKAALVGADLLTIVESDSSALGSAAENAYEMTDLVIYTKLNPAA